ncbi:hypothetical protein L9F63_004482, partial [Diploptera punctata]
YFLVVLLFQDYFCLSFFVFYTFLSFYVPFFHQTHFSCYFDYVFFLMFEIFFVKGWFFSTFFMVFGRGVFKFSLQTGFYLFSHMMFPNILDNLIFLVIGSPKFTLVDEFNMSM